MHLQGHSKKRNVVFLQKNSDSFKECARMLDNVIEKLKGKTL